MSVTARLEQLPPLVLEQINHSSYPSETLAKIEIYNLAHEISNPENWEIEFDDLISTEYIDILKSMRVNVASMVNEKESLRNTVKIPKIDLGRDWADLSIFLTGSFSFAEKEPPYIVLESLIDNTRIPFVNAINGRAFEKYENDIYQAFFFPTDVQLIEKALINISENFLEQWNLRWEKMDELEEMAAFSKNDNEDFHQIFNDLVNFYQDAARHGNAIIITVC